MELEEIRFIQVFGAAAVYGDQPIPVATMRRLLTLRNLHTAWESKNGSDNWGEWIEQNPTGEEMIQWSIQLAQRDSEANPQ